MRICRFSISHWLVCLICLWSGFSIGLWSGSAAAQLQVCPGDTEGDTGETIAVPILINDPQGIDAFGLDFLFEAEVLQYAGVLPSALTAGWFILEGSEVEPGVAMFGGFDLEPIVISTPDTLGYVLLTVGPAVRESSYTLTHFEDDLAGAADCSGLFAPGSPVEADSWGELKARFRRR